MTNTALAETEISTVGQILKTSRVTQGITLEQVSKILFISIPQLSRLENDLEDDTDQIFYDVYTLGFVKLYAQHLKLNAQEIVERFKEQHADHPHTPQISFPAPLPGQGMPSLRIIALCVFLLITIILGWWWRSDYTVPPTPTEIVLAPTPSTPAEAPLKEEIDSVKEDGSELGSTNPIVETSGFTGEHPLFEEKIFPISEKFEEDGQDILTDTEKALE